MKPFHKGIAASLVIHLAALTALGRFSFQSEAPEPPRPYLEVTFSTPSLRTLPALSDSATEAESAVAPEYPTGDSPAGESPPLQEAAIVGAAPPAVPSVDVPSEAPASIESLVSTADTAEQASQREAPSVAEVPAASGESDESRTVSASALQSSITRFVQGYRGELKQDWLAECQRYRNRHGVRECPPEQAEAFTLHNQERAIAAALFEDVSRPAADARRAAALMRDMALLRSLEVDDPLTSRLLTERYYLRRDQFDLLTGAQSPLYAAFQDTAAGRNRAVLKGEGRLSLAGTGPSLLGAVLYILGRDSFNAYGARSHINFTEYELNRPAEDEDEDGDDRRFEIRGPLFRPD